MSTNWPKVEQCFHNKTFLEEHFLLQNMWNQTKSNIAFSWKVFNAIAENVLFLHQVVEIIHQNKYYGIFQWFFIAIYNFFFEAFKNKKSS